MEWSDLELYQSKIRNSNDEKYSELKSNVDFNDESSSINLQFENHKYRKYSWSDSDDDKVDHTSKQNRKNLKKSDIQRNRFVNEDSNTNLDNSFLLTSKLDSVGTNRRRIVESLAIVSAMNALQDKVRALEDLCETERITCGKLRQKIAQMEASHSFELKADAKSLKAIQNEYNIVVKQFDEFKETHDQNMKQKTREIDRLVIKVGDLERDKEKLLSQLRAHRSQETVRDSKPELPMNNKNIDNNEIASVEALQQTILHLEERCRQNEAKLDAQAVFIEEVMHNREISQQILTKTPENSLKQNTSTDCDRTGSVARSSSGSKSNVHQDLLEANGGKPVPFVLGKSTTPSHSIYGKVQQGLADVNAYGSPPKTTVQESKSGNCRTPFSRETRDLVDSMTHQLKELERKYNIIVRAIATNKKFDRECIAELAHVTNAIQVKQTAIQNIEQPGGLEGRQKSSRSPIRRPRAYEKRVNTLKTLKAFRDLVED